MRQIYSEIISEDDFAEHHHYEQIEQGQYEERPYQKIINELRDYMQIIQDFDKDSAQDTTALHAYLIHLTQIMARANLLMADYNKKFREEKKAAYEKLTATVIKDQKYYAPSLAKDYIDAQCSETGYVFDLAERLSRLCNHTQEALRTIISSLKSERIFAQYS